MCATKIAVAIALLAVMVGNVSPAFAAETKGDQSKQQVRRLLQAQRRLELEKSELTAQKANVEAELGEARKLAEDEAQRVKALKGDMGTLRSAREALATKLAETEAELQKTLERQRTAEANGERLQKALDAERQQHAECVKSGEHLRKVSGEVLELYDKKSCFDSTLQSEPFTGLKRVQIENAVEDLRDKLDQPQPGS